MSPTATGVSTGFIADLHLDASAPEVSALATHYLRQATDLDVLWIIGDLFDAWIGDDCPFELLTEPMEALRALCASGTAVHVMHGNRDFLLGEGFAQRTGVSVHTDDAIVISLSTGLPVANVRTADSADGGPAADDACLLMHGDTLCTDDTDYLQQRVVLRGDAWQHDFMSRTLDERRAIAAQMRSGSRASMKDKGTSILDVTDAGVADAMNTHAVHTMIHGHTHRPRDHQPAVPSMPTGTRRVVLGDWHPDGAQVARFDAQQALQLMAFTAD